MNVLVTQTHTPYAFDLCRAIGTKCAVSVPQWNEIFRPMPDYVTRISMEDANAQIWDVVITDDPYETIRARRSILVSHLHQYAVPEDLEQAFFTFHDVVSVSESKRTTWRHLAKYITFIPLCVDAVDYPPIEDYSSTLVGTAYGALSTIAELADNWKGIAAGLNAVQIGHDTCPLFGEKIVKAFSWEEYKSAMLSLGVFIHCMEGDVCGYTPREAMATGIPVVTAAMPELFNFVWHGWDIIQFRGPCSRVRKEMRDYIDQLIEHKTLREKIGRNGRESILRHYPMSIFITKWRELLGLPQ